MTLTLHRPNYNGAGEMLECAAQLTSTFKRLKSSSDSSTAEPAHLNGNGNCAVETCNLKVLPRELREVKIIVLLKYNAHKMWPRDMI